MISGNNVLHSDMPQFTDEECAKSIIIKLNNFRSYGDATIKLPVNAVTLINGPSGVGKTTIFEAFIFILYNGIKNPEGFNTKRCCAWLFIGDLIVYRQKDPQLLKVWRKNSNGPGSGLAGIREYTQTDAQLVIDSIYGSQDIFFGCSYLRQKEFSVFLHGSDAEKLAIVKSVAMRGAELDEIKEPIKNAMKGLEANFTSLKGQLDMAIRNVQQFDRTNPSIVQCQIPENPQDVLRKVQELKGLLDGLDKEYETAINRETTMRLIKEQIDAGIARRSISEKAASRIDSEKLKTRLGQVDQRLKDCHGTTFDSDKAAKAQAFKSWEQEMVRAEAKLKDAEKELETTAFNIKKQVADFPLYLPREEANFKAAEELIAKIKVKLDAAKTTTTEITLLLSQADCQSIEQARLKLTAIGGDLEKAKKREHDIKHDLEKARLSKKLTCPQCKYNLVFAADGKTLEVHCPPVESPVSSAVPPIEVKAAVVETKPVVEVKSETKPTVALLAPLANPPAPVAPSPAPSGMLGMLGGLGAKKPDVAPTPSLLAAAGTPTPPVATVTPPVVSIPPPIASPAPVVTAAVAKPTDIPYVTAFTQDDLLRAAGAIATITAQRDRLLAVIKIVEEKLAIDHGVDVKITTASLTLFGRYLELKRAVDTFYEHRNQHASRRPEEVKEIVVDTTLEQQQLQQERNTIIKQLQEWETLQQVINNETLNLERFNQLLNEAASKPGQASMDVRRQKAMIQSQIEQLMHISNASDMLAHRIILEKTMYEKSEQAKTAQAEYEAAARLLVKATEAERQSLTAAMAEINTYLNQILKRLFTNIPISVEISTTKELKSKKKAVSQRFDIKIFYNNSEYGSANQLSGGEKDRLSLAITLAMSQKFGGNLLFLDETLASLDTELKSEAVALLKEYCVGRTIVCVAHEETEGIYNHVIRIKSKA
jgi:DNA repair exonuclease SbcCD ATPase subunit